MAISHHQLQRLLEDPSQSGVYHLPRSGHAALQAAAVSAGFAVFDASLADAERIDLVLAQLGRELGFPSWYGSNYDALKDCLSDPSWCEAPGYLLILSRAENLATKDAAGFQTLNEVFAAAIGDWRSQGVPMWVFYDLRDDALGTLPILG